jgi:2-C-methyl-D-erythritol 4-phosphate cytidylyltransferase
MDRRAHCGKGDAMSTKRLVIHAAYINRLIAETVQTQGRAAAALLCVETLPNAEAQQILQLIDRKAILEGDTEKGFTIVVPKGESDA